MKRIYITVLLVLAASILLIAASFVYLDRVSHKTFHYIIRSQGKDIGTIRIDRFVTENKIIYKSVKSVPFEPVYTEYRQRIVLDNNYNLESYTKERTEGRNTDIIYLENFRNLISFVSRYGSKFTFTENISVRKETFVFEEDSPVTYLPIIENYNFSSGRSQGFNAISCLNAWNLPPMKRFITLTSIKDEHIKIDSRKLDAENLILKIRDYPQGSLWISKSDRSLLKLENPSAGLTIIRTFRPQAVKAKVIHEKPAGYASKDIVFKSSGAEISGTLRLPFDDVKHTAVLFSPGAGLADRDYQGLFSSIADYLSNSGFATLTFDKTGIGSSGGEYSASTKSRELEDLGSAIEFLSTQERVDPNAIVIIGYGGGAIIALKLAAKDGRVKAVVMLAPSPFPVPDDNSRQAELQRWAKKYKWTDDYLNLTLSAMRETREKASSSDVDWEYILGKKCFLRETREEFAGEEIDFAGLSQIPILILQYKDTDGISTDAAEALDGRMTESGNEKHTLTYYAYLGPFFGQLTADGVSPNRYKIDKEVLENIRAWANSALNT